LFNRYKFRENGTPDTASQVFQKAAKLAEDVNAEKAIKLYKVAIEMFEIEDKTRQAADTIGKSIRLLVKLKKYTGKPFSYTYTTLDTLLFDSQI
jgi:hypothetical protein